MLKTAVALITLLLCAGMAHAQTYSADTVRQVVQRFNLLNYWSKTPAALKLKCAARYPDTARIAQREQMKWDAKNADFNRHVTEVLAKFKPVTARLLEKTPDEADALLASIVDEEVTQKFVQTASEKDAHDLCRNFDKLLDSMLSDDLARPRAALAERELQERFSGLLGK